jgi:hypothetical protein
MAGKSALLYSCFVLKKNIDERNLNESTARNQNYCIGRIIITLSEQSCCRAQTTKKDITGNM